MTHAEAIARLRLLAEPAGGVARPSAAERDAVIAHVARCSDCWETLAALHDAVTDGGTERATMEKHFGCEPVRDVLFVLADLDPATIAREHPAVARHLAWCLACRTRLAEVLAVEREHATAPAWIETGVRVREAVGRLAVRVGRTVAGLVEVPEGFVPGPVPLAVPVRRTGITALPRTTRFDLGASGVTLELTVEPGSGTDVGFSLHLVPPVAEPLSVHVREVKPEGEALVARHTLRAAEPVVVRGLWPGTFVLEVHGTRDAHVHRVRLEVGAGS